MNEKEPDAAQDAAAPQDQPDATAEAAPAPAADAVPAPASPAPPRQPFWTRLVTVRVAAVAALGSAVIAGSGAAGVVALASGHDYDHDRGHDRGRTWIDRGDRDGRGPGMGFRHRGGWGGWGGPGGYGGPGGGPGTYGGPGGGPDMWQGFKPQTGPGQTAPTPAKPASPTPRAGAQSNR